MNKYFPRSLIALITVWWLMSAQQVLCAGLAAGSEMIELPALSDKGLMKIWYFIPENYNSDTPILFVMHGVKRNADEYRDAWVEHAQAHNLILLVPEFDKQRFPGSRAYNLGNMFDEAGNVRNESDWSFSVIERVFNQFKQATGNKQDQYFIYGHSAGAQFVHRFLYFKPEAAVQLAIAANAGWYTLPSDDHTFPYGLKGSGKRASEIKSALARPLVLLLGDQDIDVNNQYLRKTIEANAQGPHRFARGNNYFQFARRWAAELKHPFNWSLKIAPGIDHNNQLMAPFAIQIIKDHLANRRSTDPSNKSL